MSRPFYRNLPLIKYSERFFNGICLEKTLIICVQHVVSTTYNMFHTLFNQGLKPENLLVLGKCYSTNPAVYEQLKSDGVPISPLSLAFDSHQPYDELFESYIDVFLEQLKSYDLSDFERLIVLDDGGHLIEKINNSLPENIDIIGIEQTSSGFNRLANSKLLFPIVNLSRASSKLTHESPIIIEQSKNKLITRLHSIDREIQNILIIGGGVLGGILHNELKKTFDVSVFDIQESISDIAKNNLNNSLGSFDVIIGCTGTTSLPKDKHIFLKPGVVLASVSSSDREFDAVYIRKNHLISSNCYSDFQDENICLLNSGFPINFDDKHDEIDIDAFQLTRSLILASIAQACQTTQEIYGFLSLDTKVQETLVEQFISLP